MTLILMLSLAATFAVTTPVVAGTQKWSEITMPGDKMQLLPGSDISTIAVTPDGLTLFAGVVLNQSTDGEEWFVAKSTDGGYTWKRLIGYDALGYSDEQIVAIKISPDWVNDGKMYVATADGGDGYVYMSKDFGKTWKEIDNDFAAITSMDVALDSEDAVTVVVSDEDDVYLYSDGEWVAQNAGGAVLAAAFSPDYATDGVIVAVVDDGTNLLFRAETDIDANNWGGYFLDAYFTDKDNAKIPAITASIAFPSDFSSSSSIFVGLNTENSSTMVVLPNQATGQKGDAFKVSLTSGVMATSTVIDLDIRGKDSGTDVWSIAVDGDTSAATIICGTRFASNSGSMNNWQEQIHMSTNGGESWSFAVKPPSGMGMIPTGLCAPVVVMAPDFATSETVYCGNGYSSYSGGLALSGFYASTDGGSKWNGRGLLDRNMTTITDITPSTTYNDDSTIYMITQDAEVLMSFSVQIGLLWKTTDGGDKWDLICDMIPLGSLTKNGAAVDVDKVAVVGDIVFIAGYQNAPESALADTMAMLGIPVSYTVPYLIFRSTDAGGMFPATIATRGPVEHLLAIDKDTLITANGSNIWKTINGGAKWTKADGDIEATETITGLAINGNTIIAGTDAGNVYICDDYTVEFSFAQVGKTLATTGFDDTLVAFDANYATNNILYSTITDNATKGLYRIDVATSTTGTKWDIMPTSVTYNGNVWTCGDFKSIASDSSGILWAICDATNSSNTSDIKTGVAIRSVNPTASTLSAVKFEFVLEGLESNVDVLMGNLRIASSNIFAVGGEGCNKLYTYTDTLVKVTLVSPTNGQAAAGDLLKGTSNARVVLQWSDLAKADTYQYQVALDSAFEGIVSQSSTIAGTQVEVSLYAGTKYYWRVRVASGVNSQWSDIWSFTTPLGPSAEAPVLVNPTAGQDDVILLPVLQWSGLASATKYELQVAKGCDFSGSNLIVDKTGSSALGLVTAYQMTQSLAAGTSYCWRVRALSDLSSSAWSNTGSFVTAPAPTPAPEPEGTPVYVWVIIALSAVLLVAVVMLIIRTRRT